MLVFLMLMHAFGQEPGAPGPDLLGPAPRGVLSRMALPGTEELQLIVELAQPSLVEYMTSSQGGGIAMTADLSDFQRRLSAPGVGAVRNLIAREQQAAIRRLSSLDGVRVLASTSHVINSVIARVPADLYEAVRSTPGVKRVYFSRPRRMTLDAAAAIQNAAEAWTAVGGADKAGSGIKIGIIDSGIEITNPMFTDDALVPPPGYPKGEVKFTNNKVIVARQFLDLLSHNQTVRTPIDEDGHGSFVAGIAAGKRVSAPLASVGGMAPGAYLGNYKVFGTPGINDHTSSAAVLAAIDAAVADGMDVINLSLGALDYVAAADNPEIAAIDRATAAGVVVVVAAGNEGPDPYTIGSPANAAAAITVGSVTNSRAFFSLMHVSGGISVPPSLRDVRYIPGLGVTFPGIESAEIVDVATLDGDGRACSSPALQGKVFGKIAVVAYEGCSLPTKLANLRSATAKAAIVYNPNGSEPYAISGIDTWPIPVFMISKSDWLAMRDYFALYPGASLSIDPSDRLAAGQATPRILSGFSSVGPSLEFDLKPDLVAVGGNVYSAGQTADSKGDLYNTARFTTASGTSMAAPMVAGAAAILKQKSPGISAQAVKSALVTTASRNLQPSRGRPPAFFRPAPACWTWEPR
jgi:subtilisin family serine protease